MSRRPAVVVAAERDAKAHLRYGYHQDPSGDVYVRCPRCREDIRRTVVAWAKPRERVAALVEALTEHFVEEHPPAAVNP